MTFWLIFFWTPFLPFSPHCFLPFMTSEAVHSQVSLRGACVSSHSLLFAWLSPLSTQYNCAIIRTASNRKSGRVRVTCSEKNDANSAAKDFNKGRRGKKKLESGEQSEREQSTENGDGRLPGKLCRIWRFYRKTKNESHAARMQLIWGKSKLSIASFFSHQGGLNVSNNSNT